MTQREFISRFFEPQVSVSIVKDSVGEGKVEGFFKSIFKPKTSSSKRIEKDANTGIKVRIKDSRGMDIKQRISFRNNLDFIRDAVDSFQEQSDMMANFKNSLETLQEVIEEMATAITPEDDGLTEEERDIKNFVSSTDEEVMELQEFFAEPLVSRSDSEEFFSAMPREQGYTSEFDQRAQRALDLQGLDEFEGNEDDAVFDPDIDMFDEDTETPLESDEEEDEEEKEESVGDSRVSDAFSQEAVKNLHRDLGIFIRTGEGEENITANVNNGSYPVAIGSVIMRLLQGKNPNMSILNDFFKANGLPPLPGKTRDTKNLEHDFGVLCDVMQGNVPKDLLTLPNSVRDAMEAFCIDPRRSDIDFLASVISHTAHELGKPIPDVVADSLDIYAGIGTIMLEKELKKAGLVIGAKIFDAVENGEFPQFKDRMLNTKRLYDYLPKIQDASLILSKNDYLTSNPVDKIKDSVLLSLSVTSSVDLDPKRVKDASDGKVVALYGEGHEKVYCKTQGMFVPYSKVIDSLYQRNALHAITDTFLYKRLGNDRHFVSDTLNVTDAKKQLSEMNFMDKNLQKAMFDLIYDCKSGNVRFVVSDKDHQPLFKARTMGYDNNIKERFTLMGDMRIALLTN